MQHSIQCTVGNAMNWEAKSQLAAVSRPTRTRISSAATANPTQLNKVHLCEEHNRAWQTAPPLVGLWNSNPPGASEKRNSCAVAVVDHRVQTWQHSCWFHQTHQSEFFPFVLPSFHRSLPSWKTSNERLYLLQLDNVSTSAELVQVPSAANGEEVGRLHHSKLVSMATLFTGMNRRKGFSFSYKWRRSDWMLVGFWGFWGRKEATRVNKQKHSANHSVVLRDSAR